MYPDKMKHVFKPERVGFWENTEEGAVICTRENDPLSHEDKEVLGETLAEFACEAHRLYLQTWRLRLPTVHLKVTQEELRAEGVSGCHAMAIVIELPNGKKGRVHLSLFADETANRVRAEIATIGRDMENETRKTVAVKFDDWEKPLE